MSKKRLHELTARVADELISIYFHLFHSLGDDVDANSCGRKYFLSLWLIDPETVDKIISNDFPKPLMKQYLTAMRCSVALFPQCMWLCPSNKNPPQIIYMQRSVFYPFLAPTFRAFKIISKLVLILFYSVLCVHFSPQPIYDEGDGSTYECTQA